MDEDSAVRAMTAPEEFRTERAEREIECSEGALQIELPPYAVARLDE